MKRTTRATTLSVSLPRELHEPARQAAFDDNRSLSSLITALLTQHLRREGYLPDHPTTAETSPRTRQPSLFR